MKINFRPDENLFPSGRKFNGYEHANKLPFAMTTILNISKKIPVNLQRNYKQTKNRGI
jgi:hypothetical protein